jgi:HEAT repeat protein
MATPRIRFLRLRTPPRWGGFAAAALALGGWATAAPLPALDRAQWIWGDPRQDVCEFRLVITLPEAPKDARLLITADNGYELFLNGRAVGFDIGPGQDVWGSIEQWNLTPHLTKGPNALGIRGITFGGARGVIAALRVELNDGSVLERFTDAAWRVTATAEPADYAKPDYAEGDAWSAATALGPLGMAPWGALAYSGSTGGRRQGALPPRRADAAFDWPSAIAFIADDKSIYTPTHGTAWGVQFRIGDWSRAYTQFDLPSPSKIGRRLCVLDPLGPEAEPRVLVDAGGGALGSPSVSFDGAFILFSMAPEGEPFFHLYRVPVAGGPPQQLTRGPFHDLDPAELPDGRIVFSSTRIGTFEEYHGSPSRALFVMQPDGSGIHSITHTPIFDNEPRVLPDGRIAFVRSDNFFGRSKVETQIHAIMPDGTGGQTEIGADVGADYGKRLRLLGYGSHAPLPDGRIAVISTQGNFIAHPGAAEDSFHRLPNGLGELAPLPDGRLLATSLRAAPDRRPRQILVLDPKDNRMTVIHESDVAIHSPVHLGPRPRPPVRPTTVRDPRAGTPQATGFLYSQNVRVTRKTKADWDQIRAIRVLKSRALSTRSSHWDFVHQGKEVIELGTVPIAPDGSFFVEVPADVPIAVQAVDAEGRSELNEMSWNYVRPGEVRSCVGCHEPRRSAPPARAQMAEALRTRPLQLLHRGQPHRWRGNNSGVSGMMDLQFERFREVAALNKYLDHAGPLPSGREEMLSWTETLNHADEAMRISAANRLALFRDRAAAPALAGALADESREVRVAVALALSACGTRESLPRLIEALEDPDATVAQAAAVALENLTAHREPLDPPATPAGRRRQADAWRAWRRTTPWAGHETALVAQLDSADRGAQRRAIVALGHVGGEAARAALRAHVAREKDQNPYPRFVNNNRTDTFTFNAASPMNPRTLQAAVRALGHLKDTAAVPLFREILGPHIVPETGNLFLAEAVVEALGWIGTPEAEALLIETFGRLGPYPRYVGWYSDHDALYACHSSPIHARVIEALDRIGSTRAGPIVPQLIRSVPTDPDRALFLETDTYELLVGRIIRRSGREAELIDTCLALLGDPDATASEELQAALGDIANAWAGRPTPENRAAQILSAVCRDPAREPAVRAAYERHRARPQEAVNRALGAQSLFQVSLSTRHWVLFFLGRALGNLRAEASVDTLVASLAPELNEARLGRPDPTHPNIHLLQLDPTPCWRGAAAWALGRIGAPRAAPTLLAAAALMDNAVDTRYAAAKALGELADPTLAPNLRALATDFPEVSTRRALLESADALEAAAAPPTAPPAMRSGRE